MTLIVGLGNPGTTYCHTRHNVGWRVLDALGVDFHFEKKFKAEVARFGNALFCKPQTFMNDSGNAVVAVMNFYKILVTDLVIVYDDKDLPFGTIRLRTSGGSAGHKGVQSIIDAVGGEVNFVHVRVGIQTAGALPQTDTADYVLGRFSKTEEVHLPKIIALVQAELNQLMTRHYTKADHKDLTVAVE